MVTQTLFILLFSAIGYISHQCSPLTGYRKLLVLVHVIGGFQYDFSENRRLSVSLFLGAKSPLRASEEGNWNGY
jgi:hypothetical protein